MSADQVDRIEQAMDWAASALFAAAAAFCGARLSFDVASVAVVGVASFSCCFAVLRIAGPDKRRFRLGEFALAGLPNPPEELLLTESDRVIEEAPAPAQELLLDDVLAQMAPESRVVRLFDAAAMPTPGELRARIDRHLDAGRNAAVHQDASQALHNALAELRRSIR